MNELTIDIFNKLTKVLDYYGSNQQQELLLSREGFESLLEYAKQIDTKMNSIVYKKQYSDETYKPHIPLLSFLEKEQPEFPFNGYIFKIKINS